jgi:4-hydroxythreonine-4-phosphate dehydrogenase
MIKPIAIIAGEPNSISSEVIFKAWNLRKKFSHKKFFIIGSTNILEMQKKKLNYKIKIKKIDKNFTLNQLNGPELPVLDVKYSQKKPFEKISIKSKNYIFQCFETALNFIEKKRIAGFVNCPVSKENLFTNKDYGVTEYLSRKTRKKNNEVMLIFNKELAVSPITTHIPLAKVSKKVVVNTIVKKVLIINKFYKKIFKKKPSFAILGFNPHNYSSSKKHVEEKNIKKAVKKLIKNKIKAKGPISPDSSFLIFKKYKFDVIIGMYHDQVLSPFKALYNFNAINVTLGLPYIRTSPDHGVGENIVGKKVANAKSLIESIKFFNYIQ